MTTLNVSGFASPAETLKTQLSEISDLGEQLRKYEAVFAAAITLIRENKLANMSPQATVEALIKASGNSVFTTKVDFSTPEQDTLSLKFAYRGDHALYSVKGSYLFVIAANDEAARKTANTQVIELFDMLGIKADIVERISYSVKDQIGFVTGIRVNEADITNFRMPFASATTPEELASRVGEFVTARRAANTPKWSSRLDDVTTRAAGTAERVTTQLQEVRKGAPTTTQIS